MGSLREVPISPANLLLDPNNYRFHDEENYVAAAAHRFHEESVQGRAYSRLRNEESLSALKKSIVTNGYLPVERIVVRPYDHGEEGQYVVIEGNRRTAAIKWILDDDAAGVDVPEAILDSIRELPCIVAEQEGEDEVFRASLMGIRHVSGIVEWGGFQRAKLVAWMRDDLGVPPQEAAERLGMTVHEVNRRYRAFKALDQMKEDEEFGEHGKPELYALFHEAVSVPVVRDWLGWDEETTNFTNEEELQQFYGLISPSVLDTGEESGPKITGYSMVRELRHILPQPEAKRLLLDPDKSFQEAVSVARQEEFARAWVSEVAATITALDSMGIAELKKLSQEDIDLLARLSAVCQERIADHSNLTS